MEILSVVAVLVVRCLKSGGHLAVNERVELAGLSSYSTYRHTLGALNIRYCVARAPKAVLRMRSLVEFEPRQLASVAMGSGTVALRLVAYYLTSKSWPIE